MIYDLINPSDDVTFEAPTLAAATGAVLAVGRGQLEATSEDGIMIPMMLFGDSWIQKTFDCGLEELLDNNTEAIAETLSSFATVSIDKRGAYKAQLESITNAEDRQKFLDEWDDKHRTSMNKITVVAHNIAKALKEKIDTNS